MKNTSNEPIHRSDAQDARVEVLEEVFAALRRFPNKLRLVRGVLAQQLSPEGDPTVREPVRPARRAA